MGWGEPSGRAGSTVGGVLRGTRQHREREELVCDLLEHAELHSDSKDLLLRAAAMLDPTKES